MRKSSKYWFWSGLTTIIFGLFFYSSAFAVAFGDAAIRSSLGQALNAQVPVSGAPQEDLIASCINAKIETIDGEFIASPRMEFIYPNHAKRQGSANLPTLINFTTKGPITEPAIALTISLSCGPLMQRTYTLLLDYAEIISPSAAISTVDDKDSVKKTSVPPAASLAAPVLPKKVLTTQRAGTRASVTKKSKSVAKNKNRISSKSIATVAPQKDQLKISSGEILPEVGLNSLLTNSASKTVEQKPVDADQQRVQENSLAQERFAAMLRDEPALLAAQVAEAKIAQQKIQKLEAELDRLRLQMQMNTINKPEQTLPASLIMMNVIVLVLLFVVLAVVGKLWLSLRKVRQHSTHLWWDPLTESKPKDEEKADQLLTNDEEKSPELSPDPARQEINTSKKNRPDASLEKTKLNSENAVEASSESDDAVSGTFNIFTNRCTPSIQIEEVSDLTQEAEFWVSINDPHRAIEILEPQSFDENISMPVTLFYLLDLYRLVSDEGKYVQLSARLKRKFNIHIPQFHETVDQSKMKSLEDYEHLTSRCCSFWNTNYISPYLESLLIDDREGERVGFDLSVYRDVLFLISICKELDRTNVPVTSS